MTREQTLWNRCLGKHVEVRSKDLFMELECSREITKALLVLVRRLFSRLEQKKYYE
jgi:hypothetical protein